MSFRGMDDKLSLFSSRYLGRNGCQGNNNKSKWHTRTPTYGLPELNNVEGRERVKKAANDWTVWESGYCQGDYEHDEKLKITVASLSKRVFLKYHVAGLIFCGLWP